MIRINDLEILPYYSGADPAGRIIPLCPYYSENDKKWHVYIQMETIIEISGTPFDSNYYAKEIVGRNDAYLPFLDFWYRNATYQNNIHFIKGIESDIKNLASAITHVELIGRIDTKYHDYRRMGALLFEGFLSSVRSVYDLIQEINLRLFENCRRLDGTPFCKKLPKSFSDVTLRGDQMLKPEDIVLKFRIPDNIAKWYSGCVPAFKILREWRNKIEHSGHSLDFIFHHNYDLLIQIETDPFCSFPIWGDRNTAPNKLGSMKSVMAYLLRGVIADLNSHAHVIESSIKLPGDMIKNSRLFCTWYHIGNVMRLDQIIEDPWKQNVDCIEYYI